MPPMPPRAESYADPTFGRVDSVGLIKDDVNSDRMRSEISKYALTDKGGRRPDTQPFVAVFEQEVNRVARVVDRHQSDLEFSAKALLTEAEVTAKQISPRDGHTKIHALSQKMEELSDSCISLQDYLSKNRLGLLAVARDADRQLGTQCTGFVTSTLKTNVNSVLVVVASDIYASIRKAAAQMNNGAGEDDGVWQAPSSFSRTTTKYW